MRFLAVVMAGLIVGTGCAAQSYKIPPNELARLAQTPPEARGQRVRVVQEITATDVPAAQAVGPETQIIFIPEIRVEGGHGGGHPGGRGGSGGSGGGLGKLGGGAGEDGKAAAIAFLVIAAVALVAVAGVEGSRFDGWAQLHPMHPVHLIGKDGSFQVLPLAWIDATTAAWTETAIVKPYEGPWHELDRAPLSRQGLTYGMYGGHGSFRSAYGDTKNGPAFTVQVGYFPTQEIGLLFSVFFGWRDNMDGYTLFESRYTGELQALPVQLGMFHAGVYGGLGAAYRFEDGIPGRFSDKAPGSSALTGGMMLQLDVNTRIALTARIGLARAHEEEMHDITIGLSVY